MLSCGDGALQRLWPCLLALLAGCYESHLCAGPELCDYADNDCDHQIDEDFLDDTGAYYTLEHCGSCGVHCAEVFPTASETRCDVGGDGAARCVLVACPDGHHEVGGACVPLIPVTCLPCADNDACTLRDPAARCLDLSDGSQRCAGPCDGDCPAGTACVPVSGAEATAYCLPAGGDCVCNELTLGLEAACTLRSPVGDGCAGSSTCGPMGFSPCAPVLTEACNNTDDDCDGEVDEDYRDGAGRYVSRLHCGACATPCVEPGPNMVATCVVAAGVQCVVACQDGFVDVDGIAANGCECERWDGTGPPPIVGGDADCDGVPDDTADFIYVTTTGSDTNPGTLARPVRTLQHALNLGRAQRKDVLVARGIYDGRVDMVANVGLFGGYRPDFRDRDIELYPVLLERRGGASGLPVVTCRNINTATRLEGFTVAGSDAVAPGEGSTAMYFDGCGSAVSLASLTVLAGRGADATRGNSSSDNLAALGLSSLRQLDGTDGANGVAPGATCRLRPGGQGGRKSCPTRVVSGGNGGASSCPASGCVNGRPCGNAGCTDYTVGGVCDFAAVLRDAVPNPAAQSGRGLAPGVAGERTYDAPTNRGVCHFCDDNPTLPRLGGVGGDGVGGSDGAGGLGCDRPVFLDTVTGQVRGGPGLNGVAGTDGSGGGGGTSGSGYDVIAGTTGVCSPRAGGSGGGGGSAGCGAPHASGGTGGGASIGILLRAVGATGRGPTVDNLRVVTASGGRGGDGGTGASGGTPGVGASGGHPTFWCARSGGRGGDGGRGGAGGGGGGGCGGGSHGLFLTGVGLGPYVAELSVGTLVESAGVGGRPGAGGFSPRHGGTDGLAGVATPIRVP